MVGWQSHNWQSDSPHLSGCFVPVSTETEATDLEVVSGRMPEDLCGAYRRNGPNPQLHQCRIAPLKGDGMIHAVYFDNERAR